MATEDLWKKGVAAVEAVVEDESETYEAFHESSAGENGLECGVPCWESVDEESSA